MNFGKWLSILLLAVSMIPDTYASRQREEINQNTFYLTEWSKLRHKAELGDPSALFTLGNIYFDPPSNSGFKENKSRALQHYFEAAVRQHAAAQYNVGIMFLKGLATKEDFIESYVWFHFASESESFTAKRVKTESVRLKTLLKNSFTDAENASVEKRINYYQKIMDSKNFSGLRFYSEES